MSATRRIKKYNGDNFKIVVTGIEITDTCIYGTDARFEFDVRDRDTDVLLDTGREWLEWCLPGYEDDDSEWLEEWLKSEYNIDFEKDYDYEFFNLPEEVKAAWHNNELEILRDSYLDADLADIITEDILKKLGNAVSAEDMFYIITDGKANIYEVTFDYYGPHVAGYNNNNEIQYVWNVESQSELFYVDGVYFDLAGFNCFMYDEYERDDSSAFVVNEAYLNGLPEAEPYLGKTVYSYNEI